MSGPDTKEGISSLATPVPVWERHLNTCEVLPMLQQDCVEEPKAIVTNIFILRILPSRGPEMSTNIITDMRMKVVPQLNGLSRGAGEEEEGEQVPQLFTGLHARHLQEALSPFAIILKKPSCEACFIECWVCNAVELMQVLKQRWTLGDCEQGPEIEELITRFGGDKIHPSEGKSPLVNVPDLGFLFEDKLLGEFLVCQLLCDWCNGWVSIRMKEHSQCGLLLSSTGLYLFGGFIGVEDNRMLAREVDL